MPSSAGQETAAAVPEGDAVMVEVAVASTTTVVLTRLVVTSGADWVKVVSLTEVMVTVGGNEPWEEYSGWVV